MTFCCYDRVGGLPVCDRVDLVVGKVWTVLGNL
jgi:hypothetical protein